MSDLDHARMMLNMASKDLKALQNMLDMNAFANEIFGFHAQQAVEKALKAWLSLVGVDYPRIHDLEELLALLESSEDTVPEQFYALIDLTDFAVQFRCQKCVQVAYNHGEAAMADERMGQSSIELDPALLEAHPELAVLALELPDSDGEPVENERERLQINLLLDALAQYWRDRQDFYAAGNMFLYYSTEQARQILAEEAEPARPRRAFRGPDLFIVLQVDGSYRRQKWVVWDEEGRYPDVVFEFLSPSTRRSDQTTKKTLYEHTFKTREYYWYDPFDPRVFQGWQLHPDHGYQTMSPDARGWLWSPALQLWIGRWDGTYARDHTTWVRWYDPAGRLVLTGEELATVAEQRAAVAEQRAAVAEQRAAAAEAELTRLRAMLAQLRGEGSETAG